MSSAHYLREINFIDCNNFQLLTPKLKDNKKEKRESKKERKRNKLLFSFWVETFRISSIQNFDSKPCGYSDLRVLLFLGSS